MESYHLKYHIDQYRQTAQTVPVLKVCKHFDMSKVYQMDRAAFANGRYQNNINPVVAQHHDNHEKVHNQTVTPVRCSDMKTTVGDD